MPSLAPHRYTTSAHVSPATYKSKGHLYRLDYIDTNKKGAESIAELRREDRYPRVQIRRVKILEPHWIFLLNTDKAWGVFVSGRGLGKHGIVTRRRKK